MKLHHMIAVLFVVVLIGAGYTLTIWQHSTLAHPVGQEEGISSNASEAGTNTAQATDETSSASSDAETSTENSVTESPNEDQQTTAATTENPNEEQQTTAATTENPNEEQQTTAATTTVAGTSVTFTVTATRQEDAKTPLVTIALEPSDEPLSLSGWRLADAIGAAGHADHVYYFGELTLDAGQTLTIHSACGRDQGLVRYWCLSQPLSLLDSANKALFFLDANGDLALTCTPAATDQDVMPYQCSPS